MALVDSAVRPLGARAHWAKERSGCGPGRGAAEHWVVGAADEYWPRFQRACGEMDPHRLLSVRLDEGPGVVRDHGDGVELGGDVAEPAPPARLQAAELED